MYFFFNLIDHVSFFITKCEKHAQNSKTDFKILNKTTNTKGDGSRW